MIAPSLMAGPQRLAFTFALLLSGSFWLLPFSRSFHLVLLAFLGMAIYRLFATPLSFVLEPAKKIWLLANACFALPMLVSAFSSGDLEKPLTFFALQLMVCFSGFVVMDVSRNELMLKYFHRISLAVLLFWTLDLLIQVTMGEDLFGFANDPRPGIYFSSHFKFGFYYAALSPLLLFNPIFLRWPLKLTLFIYVLVLAVVLCCNARAAWLVFSFVSFLWFGLLLRQGLVKVWQLALFVAGVAAVFIALLTGNNDFKQRVATLLPMLSSIHSVQDVIPVRSSLWVSIGSMINAKPWFGSGAGNFETAYVLYADQELGPDKVFPHAHQVILDILVGTGILGLAGWLILHAALLKLWFQSNSRSLALPIILIPFLMWFPLNTHRGIYTSELMQFTWLWLAMGIGILTQASSPREGLSYT